MGSYSSSEDLSVYNVQQRDALASWFLIYVLHHFLQATDKEKK